MTWGRTRLNKVSAGGIVIRNVLPLSTNLHVLSAGGCQVAHQWLRDLFLFASCVDTPECCFNHSRYNEIPFFKNNCTIFLEEREGVVFYLPGESPFSSNQMSSPETPVKVVLRRKSRRWLPSMGFMLSQSPTWPGHRWVCMSCSPWAMA